MRLCEREFRLFGYKLEEIALPLMLLILVLIILILVLIKR